MQMYPHVTFYFVAPLKHLWQDFFMIPNQKQTGPVWRINAQGLIIALEEFIRGEREMTAAQVTAAKELLKLAKTLAGGNEEALKELE